MSEHGFGRILQDDPRNANYPLRARLMAAPEPTRMTYHNRTGPILNQGQTGTCVGHGWRQWYASALVMGKRGPDQWQIYREACKRDPWPENDNGDLQAGTSVLAGAQYLKEAGIIESYHWTRSAEDAADAILSKQGVLVFGLNWYRGMSEPDHNNIMHLTGPLDGGHCIVGSGYTKPRGLFRFPNSWGTGWADGGRAWLPGEDLQRLLDQNGECCLAIQVAGT
jgi:hypothetical protein